MLFRSVRALAQVVADRIALAVETHALRRQSLVRLRQLEESVARLDTVLRSAPVGFAFLDRNLHYVQVSEALAALNGVPVEAHIGRHVRDVVPDVLEARLMPQLERVLATGEPVKEFELKQASAQGDLHFLASAYPVRVHGGAPLGVGLLLVDITARKREEQALALSEQRFRSLAQATAEIVWMVMPTATSATTRRRASITGVTVRTDGPSVPV